jgi:hypothetical protein
MPVISTVISSRLRLMVQTGVDDEGNPVVRSRNLNNLKPEATDEAVYTVAGSLGELQQHPVNAVRKVTESDLVFME